MSIGTEGLDANGRIAERRGSDGSFILSTYSMAGTLESVIDGRGTTVYEHDASGRLSSRTEPDGRSIAYEYDAAGRVSSISTPAGTTTKTYDELGRLSTVTDAGGTTTYAYDAEGQLIMTVLPNGVTEARTYDLRGRVQSIVAQNSTEVVWSVAYTLNAKGQRTYASESDGRSVAWAYDGLGRLVLEDIVDPVFGDRAISYAYDEVGNRTSRVDSVAGTTVYSYDANDRLLTETDAVGVITSTYDDAGRLLTRGRAASDRTEYVWNADSRLTSVRVVTATSSHLSTFEYDLDGMRVEANDDGVVRRFLLDESVVNAVVAVESDGGGFVTTGYANGIGSIAQIRDGTRNYFHGDVLESVRALTDSDGARTGRTTYSSFGEVLGRDGPAVAGLHYLGEDMALASELVYLRARYYDSHTGRFVSRDPLAGVVELGGSGSAYVYAMNNPVSNYDRSGLFSAGEQLAAVSVLSTLVDVAHLGVVAAVVVDQAAAVVSEAIVEAYIRGGDVPPNGRRIGWPLFIVGSRHPGTGVAHGEVRDHVHEAQMQSSIPGILQQGPGSYRGWWDRLPNNPCAGGGEGSGVDCDEYPFNATMNGGRANYLAGRVSLRLLGLSQNRSVGGMLGNFYRRCATELARNRGNFGVIARMDGGESQVRCE